MSVSTATLATLPKEIQGHGLDGVQANDDNTRSSCASVTPCFPASGSQFAHNSIKMLFKLALRWSFSFEVVAPGRLRRTWLGGLKGAADAHNLTCLLRRSHLAIILRNRIPGSNEIPLSATRGRDLAVN